MKNATTIIGLDIGMSRTGVAISYPSTGMAVAKDTVHSSSPEELVEIIRSILDEAHCNEVVCGLPLLPGGREGNQSEYVRAIAKNLTDGYCVHLVDERYTTPRNAQYDGNAAAACSILNAYLEGARHLTL